MKKTLMNFLIAILLLFTIHVNEAVAAATLLPNGEQQFIDENGAPYASGSVYFYIPNTLTPKTTWQNPTQSVLNVNPVTLDSAGRAVIYGAGAYRQILKDALGNTIWDKLTASTGSVSVGMVDITQQPYNAVCNGTADDTAALTSAIASGYIPFVPPTLNGCAVNITLAQNAVIVGSTPPLYAETSGTWSKLVPVSGATSIINLSGKKLLTANLDIFGGGFSSNIKCITAAGGTYTAWASSIRYCGNGGYGENSPTSRLFSYNSNWYGDGNNTSISAIVNIVDSQIVGGAITSSGLRGVYLPTGADSNAITGVRIEQNNHGDGVYCFQCSKLALTNNTFDRNSGNAVHLNGCSHVSITGGYMWRNGATNTYGNNNHVYFEGTCTDVSMVGVATQHGLGDGATLPDSPAHVITFNAATDASIAIVGNGLTGYVSTPIVYNVDPVDAIITNNSGVANISFGQNINYSVDGRTYYRSGEITILTATSGTFVATGFRSVNTFDRNRASLQVIARSASSAASYAGNFNLLFVREGGACTMTQGAIEGEIGTAGIIQFGAGTLSLSTSAVATDCSGFTLSIANTIGNTVNARVYVRE